MPKINPTQFFYFYFFFYFFNIDWNSLKKNQNRNMAFLISNLVFESIFYFGKWSNGKSANTLICGFSILIFLWRVLVNFLKSQKMNFYCIFKKWFRLGRVLFLARKKIMKKPNTLEYSQVLLVTCRKLNSDQCLLRPPSLSWGLKSVSMSRLFKTKQYVKTFKELISLMLFI